jgi:hypothetical protein
VSEHVCPRCGHEDHCGYGSWADRHPVMATIGGLFALVFMGMMFSVHPVASTAMVAMGAAVVGVRAAARERSRRHALAARADYEHARLMAQSQMPPIRLQAPPPLRPERHVMNSWPTTPIHTGRR